MKCSSSVALAATAIFVCVQVAQSLTVKPNAAPIVTNTIASSQQYVQTTRVLDLNAFFADPDASAAVRLTTPYGVMNFTLDGATAPLTVANFLNYVNSGRYYLTDPTTHQPAYLFFHRRDSIAPLLQSGGYIGTVGPTSGNATIPTAVLPFTNVPNEPFISNTRGTITIAKGADPDSANSQWWINLANNTSFDDPGNPVNTGGLTAFGHVAGNGMTVADTIGALPRFNFTGAFYELPVRNYTQSDYNNGVTVKVPNLISITEMVQIPPLNFAVVNSNTTAVSATVSGTQLLVTGNQPGTAQITVTATDLDGLQVAQQFNVTVVAAPGRLRNISTRVSFPQGNEVLIGGFILRGGTSKRLAVRALGPSLAGIANPLANPTLELRDGSGNLIASNDNWATGTNTAELSALSLAPGAASESALIAAVPSSNTITSYTTVVRSGAATPGVGEVEVYDLDTDAGSTILNLSTRGTVGTGNNVMIGGFITGGTDARRLIVRALGPSLTGMGVTGVLPDPKLELRDANGTVVASNDNWQTDPGAAEIQSYNVAPTNPLESALITTVPSGAYTAVVSGAGNQPTGVALVEIFQVQ